MISEKGMTVIDEPKKLQDRVEELARMAPEARHSYFQLRYFVIGKEPTTQGQLWQCLREIKARRDTLDDLTLQIDDIKDDLELAQAEPTQGKHPAELRKMARRRERLTKTLLELHDKVKYTVQEVQFLVGLYGELETLEPCKDFDDEAAQKEYWGGRFEEEVNLRILLNQGLPVDLVKSVLACTNDMPVRVQIENTLNFVEQRAKQRLLNEQKDHQP